MQKLLLLIIQSITEVIPVSSTGHLVIAGNLMGIDLPNAFITLLHIPSTVAILVFFRKRIFNITVNALKDTATVIKIIITIIPAGLIGYLMDNYIQAHLHGSITIILSLIIWGIAMIVIEQALIHRKLRDNKTSFTAITYLDSFFVGIAQVLALIPGTSRSGITVMGGILRGVRKDISLEFSFIIGLPLIIGSSVHELIRYGAAPMRDMSLGEILGGFFLGFVISYVSIWLLVGLSRQKYFLTLFGIYRILLGTALLFVLH